MTNSRKEVENGMRDDIVNEQELKSEDRPLYEMYSTHHIKGNRLRNSVREEMRAKLFGEWIGTGKDLLDLGCRDAQLTRHFVKDNNVTGCDIDRDALAYAEETYGMKVRHVNLNHPLPFESESFDVVMMAETIEHLPYPGITLSEIRRVLRKGGIFIGNAPIAYHIKNRIRVIRGKLLDDDPTHCQYFTYDSLMKLLGRYFTIDEVPIIKGDGLAWLSKSLFARNVAFKCSKPAE